MLRCSTSLWSADLANLASEIRRVEPHSERFHLDVADGHYMPALLFFPDLVAAIRSYSSIPFEVHLMTTDPLRWVGPFSDAGADGFIFCLDTAEDPSLIIRAVKERGKFVGISLLIDEGLERMAPYLGRSRPGHDLRHGGRDQGSHDGCGDPREGSSARRIIDRRGLSVEVEVDGGIRRQSVPLIRDAGADWIVSGSLIFGEDPAGMRRWLASL